MTAAAVALHPFIYLYINALPVRDTSPYVLLEDWIGPALAKVAQQFQAPHYLMAPYNGWRGPLEVEVRRMAAEVREPLYLVCDARSLLAQTVIEALTPVAGTIVRGFGV